MRRLTLHERINLRSWIAPVVVLRTLLIRLPMNEMLRTGYAVTGRPVAELVQRPRPPLKPR